jgi:chemotaxis protein CheD
MDYENLEFSTGSTQISRNTPGLEEAGMLNSHFPIQLGIGDLMVTGGARPLVTVVGSCLAMVISAPAWGISGMVHAMYPSRSRRLAEAGKASRLFVDEAIEDLLAQFTGLGILRSQLVLKLFGGASITFQEDTRPGVSSPGEANLVVARRVIAEAGLHLAAEDVGGRFGRKVILHPKLGEVHVKRLVSASESLGHAQESPTSST